MFEEEYVLWPVEGDDHRAEYLTDELKIRYILPFITDGQADFMRCVTHEWIHGLVDWAMGNDTELSYLKRGCDPSGETDHFIMRLIMYD